MKNNNNKGFVLAEAVTVGVFILSLFTFLFINIIPLIGRYESVEQYDTIDAVYNTNMVRMILLENENTDLILTLTACSGTFIKYNNVEAFCNRLNDEGEDINSKSFCTKLLGPTYLNVDKIIITKFRLKTTSGSGTGLKNIINNPPSEICRTAFTREEKEYILSLDDYTQPTNDVYDSYHRIIVEYKDGSFANLEIKK